MRRARAVALVLALAGAVVPAAASAAGKQPPRPTSVVAMGDSVASGEGTLYGYRYDRTRRTWVGGDLNVAWSGPYPLCHDSPDAYGNVVAAHYRARLALFACTGSTFAGGIAGPKFDEGQLARPAQFGDWATRTGLNAAYDRARPDLVLITLGADDVQFTSVVRACAENRVAAQLLHAPLQCTAADPGPTVATDVTAALPALLRNEATLVDWIVARGRADGRVPRIVFTTYYDPFPSGGASCPDTELLAAPQVSYLGQLLGRFDQTLASNIRSLHRPGVSVVDLYRAFDGHRWCSTDPWAYGLSIFRLSDPVTLLSQAPFHPTPVGQQRIAGLVESAVDRLSAGPAPR